MSWKTLECDCCVVQYSLQNGPVNKAASAITGIEIRGDAMMASE